MTMKHIKIFIAVCDTGSMTAAAKELYIAQPAVSFAIAEMENYYGQKLFDRISNRLHITEAGKQFLRYSRKIVSLFDEMECDIKNWDTLGTLRIGCSTTIGTTFLPDLIKDFNLTHPDVFIQVTVDHTNLLENILLDNQVDFALIEGIPFNKFLKYQKIIDNPMTFLCSTEHEWANRTISIEQLQHSNFIMREKESSERKILDEFLQLEKINVNILWQSISQHSILKAVENNLGIAALSHEICKDALESGKISPFYIKNVSLKRDFYIIYHQNKFLTNLMKDFIDLCHKI